MGQLDRSTIHKALDSPRFEEILEPTDVTVKSYEILREVYDEMEIPVDFNKIGVAEVRAVKNPFGTWYGSAVAYGCGTYFYGEMEDKWEVEKTPKGYIIAVNQREMAGGDVKHRKTVRHELAHIINFETHGYTVEKEGIHAEWMDKLDAWESYHYRR